MRRKKKNVSYNIRGSEMSRNKKNLTVLSINSVTFISSSLVFFLFPFFYYADKTNEASGIKRKLEQKSFVISKLFQRIEREVEYKKKVGDFTRYIHDHHFM